jgi:superfamily II DNA or RNA helicase
MSIKINIDSIPFETREKMASELTIKPVEKNKFGKNKYSSDSDQSVEAFTVEEDDDVCIPLRYALDNVDCKIKDRSHYKPINVKFTGTLRQGQQDVKDEAISILNSQKTCILALCTGYGKSSLSVYLATKIKLQTLILCHRLILVEQWKSTIERFVPGATVQILKSKTKVIQDSDFYIVNAQNLSKIGREKVKGCGLVIVDEIHTFCTKNLIESLFYCHPRYLLGLSATPYRSDGMDKLLDVYFGDRKIYRSLNREHIVYKVDTKLVPETRIGVTGKLDWNSVIESQTTNIERNELIVSIARKFSDRHILILSKRVDQANYLTQRLIEEGDSVTSIIGTNNKYDANARIVVATSQKCGVGFSHDILDMLILASDVEEYFIQYLGRVIRTEEVKPIVFDLVDDHPTLKRHFATRKKIYLESGGKIEKYNLN